MVLGTHVACFGYEPVLLESRCKVLATRFPVIAITTLEALEHYITSGYVRLLVICHTVPELDCLAAVAMANHSPTEIKTVLLIFNQAPLYASVQTIRVYEGPAALLNKLSALLCGNLSAMDRTESKPTTPFSSRPVLQPAEEARGEAMPDKTRICRPQT